MQKNTGRFLMDQIQAELIIEAKPLPAGRNLRARQLGMYARRPFSKENLI
jgi:hypothetical protein